MVVPLSFQISEFDCGPVSLLNALSRLFDRKLIQPCMIKAIYSYTLDNCDAYRHPGQKGTSAAALRFVGEWLNNYGAHCHFPIHCVSLAPEDICFEPESPLYIAIRQGAVAVVRCILDVGHYVLITGVEEGHVLVWDPYYLTKKIRRKGIEIVKDRPAECNRRISFERMNGTGRAPYNFGPVELRECLLIWNTDGMVQGEPPLMLEEPLDDHHI